MPQRAQGPRRGVLTRLAVVLLLLVLAIGTYSALQWAGMVPPLHGERVDTPRPPHALPPPPSRAALEPRKLAGGAVELRLSEEQLNGLMGERAAAYQDQLENPWIDLAPGRLVFTGDLKQGPLKTGLRVVLAPAVENGRVVLRVQEASLGKLRVAPRLTEMAARAAEDMLASEQQRHPRLVVEKVVVTEDALVLSGHEKQ